MSWELAEVWRSGESEVLDEEVWGFRVWSVKGDVLGASRNSRPGWGRGSVLMDAGLVCRIIGGGCRVVRIRSWRSWVIAIHMRGRRLFS